MDNQHKLIKGYRDLSQFEIDQMNRVKVLAEITGKLVAELQVACGLDQRWIAEGRTDLQKGFMSLVRAIAQPESF